MRQNLPSCRYVCDEIGDDIPLPILKDGRTSLLLQSSGDATTTIDGGRRVGRCRN